MATGGTPSGRAFVFDVERPRGGGYSTYAPTGYAASYAQGKGIMEMLDWQDKKRGDAMEEQWLQGREQRQEDREARADARLEMQSRREELAVRRQQEREDRDQYKKDQLESKKDRLDKVAFAIDSIDHLHKNAPQMLDDIRHTQDFHDLSVDRDTKNALKDILKQKADEIQGIQLGIQHEARSKYGIDADLSQFPADEKGKYDFNKGYREHLPQLAKQAYESAQVAYEAAPDKHGYVKYAENDKYGRPVAKYVKEEDVNKQKLEEMRLARGAQLQSLGAIQALRQEAATTLGGFKQKELENPTAYFDANGKPTKDPNQAATAVWIVKGKEVARMPEADRQGKIQTLQSISSSIKDFGTMAFPSATGEKQSGQPVMTTPPQATAPTPAAKEATQVKEETMPSGANAQSSLSPDNPYAEQVKKEQEVTQIKVSEAKSKEAAKKIEKEKRKQTAGWYQASQEEKQAQENLKDPSRLVAQQGEFPSDPTPQELANAYELAKSQLNKAKAKRFYYEARDPEWVSINLGDLKGDELESFKRDYLGLAIFEEAGNDPQKASAIAKERGYDFFLE
jgi:hypothetical protein